MSIDDGRFKLFPSSVHTFEISIKAVAQPGGRNATNTVIDQPKSAQRVFQDSTELLGELSLKNEGARAVLSGDHGCQTLEYHRGILTRMSQWEKDIYLF